MSQPHGNHCFSLNCEGLCLTALGRAQSISSSLFYHMQSSSFQSLPSHFFLLSPLCHPYQFTFIFLWFFFPLFVPLPLPALASYSLPSIPHVQSILTFLFLIILLYRITLFLTLALSFQLFFNNTLFLLPLSV